MSIPIENIYFLLCYAWNNMQEKERVSVDVEDSMEILDLFAKILIIASKILLKRGIDRNYIDYTSEYIGVKGKIEISKTLKHNLIERYRSICTYDTLSSNILPNRILVTTIQRMVHTQKLNKQLKYELRSIRDMLIDVDEIELSNQLFSAIRLNRNNRFYAFILNICKIVYENTLPTERKGNYLFTDFTRDEAKMNLLFEEFVRNFYLIEESLNYSVKRERIYWKMEAPDSTHYQYLPWMETDITLTNALQKIIIDTKYYSRVMNIHYDQEKIHSTNLYQLFSYLMNQETDDPRTKTATGILLYATVDREYNLHFKHNNHDMFIKTVNLNTNWRNITSRLKQIIYQIN